VSARHHPNQFELFPDAFVLPNARLGLIAGLAVHLIGTVKGRGPAHYASGQRNNISRHGPASHGYAR
jgi:hypothetical protein